MDNNLNQSQNNDSPLSQNSFNQSPLIPQAPEPVSQTLNEDPNFIAQTLNQPSTMFTSPNTIPSSLPPLESASQTSSLPPLQNSQEYLNQQNLSSNLPPTQNNTDTFSQPLVSSILPPLPNNQTEPQINNINNALGAVTTSGKVDTNKIIALLQTYMVDKFPFPLSEKYLDKFVEFLPYVFILDFIRLAIGSLEIMSLIPRIGIFSLGFHTLLSLFFIAGVLVFDFKLIPGLFKRSVSGWMTAFYFLCFYIVCNILLLRITDAFSAFFFGFFILFQCRSKYIN